MYKNKLFNIKNPEEYINKYFDVKYNLIKQIDNKKFFDIIKIVNKTIKSNKNIYVCGNG